MIEYKNSKVICIKSGSSMKEAGELMSVNRIRHLPVVGESMNIIAMLSKRDLTDVDKFQQLPVDLFSSSPVEYVLEETPLANVTLKMIEKKISCVLLTNANKEVVGIITTDDLLFQFSQMLTAEEEKKEKTEFTINRLVTTAGDFFKKLTDIGI